MVKKLELVWPHKGEHVLQNLETEKWEFTGTASLPPCPLIEIDTFGDEKGKPFNPEKDNLLIKGENLFALQTLLPYYAGQVKLIYIDPPFNTGQDFEAYDDNFEHSVWLSMMMERLKLSREFLKEDGVVFVHIDNREIGHLKVLMDQIFLEKNFVQIISEKRASPAGFKTINPGPLTVTDYILMYAKDKTELIKKWQPMYTPVSYDENYDIYIENIEDSPENWKFKKINEIIYEKHGFKDWKDAKKEWGNDWKLIRASKAGTFALENADRVASIRDPHKPSEAIKELLEKSKVERDKLFVLPREEYDDIYIINGGALSFYKNKIKEIDGELTPTEILTDLWDDINYAGIAKEGNVTLKNGKKPEMLLRRIIEMSTKKDDLVLDFFGGSGTTGAVAHKLGQRWISIEVIENQVTDSLGRLQRVVTGEDQTGISTRVNWKGGGGFRFLAVGAPLLIEDRETKLTIINPHYVNGPLTRAVCAVEGFLLTGDTALHGRNGEHYAHVTEDFVDDTLVKKLKKRLKDGQFLTIYAAKGVRRGLKLPNGIQVMRINSDLIKKYTRSK